MDKLCVFTTFEPPRGELERPSICGLVADGRVVVKKLFMAGEGKSLSSIYKSIDQVRDIILSAAKDGTKIVLSDYKRHIRAFGLPLDMANVYDLNLPVIKSKDSDVSVITRIMEKMMVCELAEYQATFANATVAYEDLQRNGLVVNHERVWPVYSQQTYSGRSKTLGYNIQGLSDDFNVWSPNFPECDILIHFDWVCADIRVASLLSGDSKLASTFVESDPYVSMMDEINSGLDADKLTRDESKLFLLKSINSMDFTSAALSEIYPKLGYWIMNCKATLSSQNSVLTTILGKKFKLGRAKNELAVLNGIMQGSVAHAMQGVVRRVWDEFGTKLITEIHDSLVVSSSRKNVSDTIDAVSKIMLHPFNGLIDTNPTFPVRISVGKKWRKWKLLYTRR